MESNDWTDAERRMERAQELFEQRRWQEAVDELRAATNINPYNAAWFYNLGLTLDQLGEHAEAIDAYQHGLAIEPHDLNALQRLGCGLTHLGRFRDAIDIFQRIEALEPACEAAYCGRILAHAELGEHEQAEVIFYQARLYKDHCPDCYFNLGVSLAARERFDKAIHCWQQVLDLEPDYPQAHLRIAAALWAKRELESARQHYLQALRNEPGDVRTMLDLAELLEEMGRAADAGEKIRQAIEIAPDDAAARFCYGRWLLRHEKLRDIEAEAMLQRVIELDPTFPGAHLELARLFQRRHDLENARRQLRAELLLRPAGPRVLMDLGNLLIDLSETRPAIACFKRLTQAEPGNSRAWQNLAVAQFLRGRYEDGFASSRIALRTDPHNRAALHNYAWALGRARRFTRALACIARARRCGWIDASFQRLELHLRMAQLRVKMDALISPIFPAWLRRKRRG